ncbi:hypothetical protein LZ30DRAFT_773895 [Colletotrichum cereale]|nr:hypothetical protein LZ30DRAFT_773895 [Colletotrichum cereale]
MAMPASALETKSSIDHVFMSATHELQCSCQKVWGPEYIIGDLQIAAPNGWTAAFGTSGYLATTTTRTNTESKLNKPIVNSLKAFGNVYLIFIASLSFPTNVKAGEFADFDMVFTMRDVVKAVTAAVTETKSESHEKLAKNNSELRLEVAHLKSVIAKLEGQLAAEKADKHAKMAALTKETDSLDKYFLV